MMVVVSITKKYDPLDMIVEGVTVKVPKIVAITLNDYSYIVFKVEIKQPSILQNG